MVRFGVRISRLGSPDSSESGVRVCRRIKSSRNRRQEADYISILGQTYRARLGELQLAASTQMIVNALALLGLVESALRRWVEQLQEERQGVTPKSKALTPEQQKI